MNELLVIRRSPHNVMRVAIHRLALFSGPRLGCLLAIILATVLVLLPSSAVADTHYVSKTGSNTYPYDSWVTAADTVARAVEAASEWDTILIAPGHFVTDTIRMKRGQVLKGAGIDFTILDTFPAGSVRPIIAEDSCLLRDFGMEFLESGTTAGAASTAVVFPAISINRDRAIAVKRVRFVGIASCIGASFQDASQTGRVCVIDSCECIDVHSAIETLFSRVEIRNCVFRWDRDAIVGVIIADYTNLTVENCRFFGYDPVVVTANAAAISTALSESILIRNNLFYSTMDAEALDLNCRDGSSVPMSMGLIENNTFIGFLYQFTTTRSGWVFRNNISFKDRTSQMSVPFYSGLAIGEYNITWDNSPWDSGVVRGTDTIPNDIFGNHDNRNVLPMFVDTLDFLLQAFSPAIDAGDPSILDADGSRSDIGYTGGPGGFSYAYPDLAPAVPSGLKGAASDSQIVLAWRGNSEADFDHYELFRDRLPITAADSALLLASGGVDSSYVDRSIVPGEPYYYRLRAVDTQGNGSGLSNEVQFVAAGVGDDGNSLLPEAFTLQQNYPNPFNSSTRVALTVNSPGHLSVVVYNATGRLVDVLYKATAPRGELEVDWSPTNLSSGVYFLRITAASKASVLRVLYLK